jgi:hypothetical protein
MSTGTPKTLEEAIKNGLQEGMYQRGGKLIAPTKAHVQDFIAQRFQVAKCRAHKAPLTEADLQILFEEIVK